MLKTFLLPIIRNYVPNLIRHGAQLSAGYLLSVGVLNESDSQIVTAGAIALASALWSWIEKQGLLQKLIA